MVLRKTRNPRVRRSKREGMEMSCASSWRIYPRRSIASRSICGSGRLFLGLERETRSAERMTELIPERMRSTGAIRTGARMSASCHVVKEFLQKRKLSGQIANCLTATEDFLPGISAGRLADTCIGRLHFQGVGRCFIRNED